MTQKWFHTGLLCSFVVLLSLLCGLTPDSSDERASIRLWYGQQPFVLNDSAFLFDHDTIVFTELRFYLGHFELLDSLGNVFWKSKEPYHLVDAEVPKSLLLNLPTTLPDSSYLRFHLGVDSATSCSGAMGGDLDPTKGMFWTWNSGYINFKVEGRHAHCKSRNNEFEFHIGGYRKPNETVREVVVPFHNGHSHIDIHIDVFLKNINLRKEHRVMSPGKRGAELADQCRLMFKDVVDY